MNTTGRSLLLAGALALAGGLGLAAPARAQIGSYQDFPFQQGSLFYRPQGNPLSRHAYSRRQILPRSTHHAASRSLPTPYQYLRPAGTYSAPQPRYYYQSGMYGGYR